MATCRVAASCRGDCRIPVFSIFSAPPPPLPIPTPPWARRPMPCLSRDADFRKPEFCAGGAPMMDDVSWLARQDERRDCGPIGSPGSRAGQVARGEGAAEGRLSARLTDCSACCCALRKYCVGEPPGVACLSRTPAEEEGTVASKTAAAACWHTPLLLQSAGTPATMVQSRAPAAAACGRGLRTSEIRAEKSFPPARAMCGSLPAASSPAWPPHHISRAWRRRLA
jgi:hypothetical protein